MLLMRSLRALKMHVMLTVQDTWVNSLIRLLRCGYATALDLHSILIADIISGLGSYTAGVIGVLNPSRQDAAGLELGVA